MKKFCVLVTFIILGIACKDKHNHSHDHSHEHEHTAGHTHSHDHGDIELVPVNTLTEEEKEAGWTLLFDGENLDHWTGYKSDRPTKWSASDNTLFFNPKADGSGGDIITKNQYKDFEFALDWKIDKCGNSGIFWNVVEKEGYDRTFHSGPEMQILDNSCHPDAKITKHRAGDLYDLIETSVINVKPALEWNSIRITSKDGHYTFHQNGEKVVEFDMHTPEWNEMVDNSKFTEWPGFGKSTKGHIALQDHSDKVWFRNIRIREI